MPSPTFVSATTVAAFGNNTSPKTVSVTVNNGDCIAVMIVSDGQNGPFSVSGGGLVYTRATGTDVNAANECETVIYTASATSTQTFTLSVSETATTFFGFSVFRFSSAVVVGSGSSIYINGGTNNYLGTITTTSANSAVVCCAADFNANDGSSRSWNQGTLAGIEEFYALASPNYTVYGAYCADSGATGTYTLGPTNNLSAAAQMSVSLLEIGYQTPSAPAATATAGPAWAPMWRAYQLNR